MSRFAVYQILLAATSCLVSPIGAFAGEPARQREGSSQLQSWDGQYGDLFTKLNPIRGTVTWDGMVCAILTSGTNTSVLVLPLQMNLPFRKSFREGQDPSFHVLEVPLRRDNTKVALKLAKGQLIGFTARLDYLYPYIRLDSGQLLVQPNDDAAGSGVPTLEATTVYIEAAELLQQEYDKFKKEATRSKRGYKELNAESYNELEQHGLLLIERVNQLRVEMIGPGFFEQLANDIQDGRMFIMKGVSLARKEVDSITPAVLASLTPKELELLRKAKGATQQGNSSGGLIRKDGSFGGDLLRIMEPAEYGRLQKLVQNGGITEIEVSVALPKRYTVGRVTVEFASDYDFRPAASCKLKIGSKEYAIHELPDDF